MEENDMPISELHTNWLNGSYQADRDLEIKRSENDPLLQGTDLSGLRPHFDRRGRSIAVGYGLDLLVNDNTTINAYLAATGLGALSAEDSALLDEARDRRRRGTANEAYLTSIATRLAL